MELAHQPIDNREPPCESQLQSEANQPENAEARHQLAEVYYAQGKLEGAIASCYQALRYHPNFAPAYKTLGNILQAQNKIEPAIRAYSKALEIKPDFAEALANLGGIFYKQGQLDRAEEHYRKALEIAPNLAAIYWNLGKVLEQQNEKEQALICQQKAIELQPDLFGLELLVLRGKTFYQAGKLDEAIECYQRAIAANPKDATAYFYLGVTYLDGKQFSEAIACYQTAIELQPNFAEAHCNLAIANIQKSQQQGSLNFEDFQRAIDSFLRAIELKPDFAEAHRGCFELVAGFWTGNIELLTSALEKYTKLCPGIGKIIAETAAISTYLQAGASEVASHKFLELEKFIYEYNQNSILVELEVFYRHLLFDTPHLRDDLPANSNLFRFAGKQYRDRCLKASNCKQFPTPNSQWLVSNSSTIRIGFLSKHFWRHSVGWCSHDLIRELSKITPHLYCYGTGYFVPDDITEKFKQGCQQFYLPKSYIKGFADPQEIIGKILADKLDVLVDLDSFTVPVHAEILLRQPAPICISWLGFEAPFLLENNFFLGDWRTHPKGCQKYYCERLIRMPDSFVAVSGFETQPIDRSVLRKARRISPDQVVYLCVAPGRKLNPDLVRAQVTILKEVPDSLLIYKGLGDIKVIQLLYYRECQAQGVSFHRIKFIERTVTEEQHRLIYGMADILLDSYPYNGSTQTLEGLWFNVPLVTRTGGQYLSRMGYSFLTNLGIKTGVSQSWEEYIEWGIKLGKNADLRNAVREQLQHSKQPESLAPLWNPKKLAQDMYEIFGALLRHQAGISDRTIQDLLI